MNLDPRPIEDLVSRVDAELPTPAGRVVGFIASGAGEGTSTLSEAYARTSALLRRRRVLLLRKGTVSKSGVLEAVVAGESPDGHVQPLADGAWAADYGRPDSEAVARDLIARDETWQHLRKHFDEIVLDLPDAASSRVGLTMASQCDGVVVVLEAEKTRAPVAQNLVASLRAVRARVLGSVLNRRRYHVPQRVYRWL